MKIVVVTSKPIFYNIEEMKDHRHTGEYIAGEISEDREKLGTGKIFALVTDNGSNMKATRTIESQHATYALYKPAVRRYALN